MSTMYQTGRTSPLIAHTVRYYADIGNNVIVEGNLVVKHYRDMLGEVLAEHHGSTHALYLDVPP